MEDQKTRQSRPTYSTHVASSRPLGKMNTMVGFDDELVQLMDKLEGGQPNLQIILIDGMGGIGKTTLARNAYQNSLIVQHFDTRSWATISQTHGVKGILCDLLSSKKEQIYNEMDQEKEGTKLYKILFGRKYLVILDDMWSVDAWDSIRLFLPNSNNGSRVVITTRQSHMSNLLGYYSLSMRLLIEDQSWELFCEKVFARECCPPELEKAGKEIAKSCKGLPLSIYVIGGLLRNSFRTLENWKTIAKDVNSILNSRGDEMFKHTIFEL